MSTRILVGDVTERLRELPDESVHCAITSPPYWGLRDYGVDGMIGLEATPEEWCARLVEVFGEVRRVLRADGTCWVNLGDAYAAAPKGNPGAFSSGLTNNGRNAARANSHRSRSTIAPGYKPKDLLGLPWLLAFALRAGGWYLRSEIIWAKGVSFCPTYSGSVMPESVTDRPTKGHETVFLLAKSARYFYDAEAVREAQQSPDNTGDPRSRAGVSRDNYVAVRPGGALTRERIPMRNREWNPSGRNLRDVWTINPQPLPEAHFASYPRALVRPCIQAGTSERGVCGECGAPWERVVERTGGPPNNRFRDGLAIKGKTAHAQGTVAGSALSELYRKHGYPTVETTGWRPTCPHEDAHTVPATVLDPFGGSGTSALVARELGRDAILIELNPEYAAMSERRLSTDGKGTPDMFADVTLESTPCTD